MTPTFWRVRTSATGPLWWPIAARQASTVSVASAGRSTTRSGMARNAASCSIGWWGGPALPRAPAPAGLGRSRRPEHHELGDAPKRGELLDRLVGRAVLAQSDRIVAERVNHREPAQRREADRRSH